MSFSANYTTIQRNSVVSVRSNSGEFLFDYFVIEDLEIAVLSHALSQYVCKRWNYPQMCLSLVWSRPIPSFTSPLDKSEEVTYHIHVQAIVSAIPDDFWRDDDDWERCFLCDDICLDADATSSPDRARELNCFRCSPCSLCQHCHIYLQGKGCVCFACLEEEDFSGSSLSLREYTRLQLVCPEQARLLT